MDSNGLSPASGTGAGTLDTATLGPHTYTVTATTNDDVTTAAVVNYKVADPPIVSIVTPAIGATFKLAQGVGTDFTCADGTDGTGIELCLDQGAEPSGAALDTATTGAHHLMVTAASRDGLISTESISYTVAASPSALIAVPIGGAHYALGQTIHTSFLCAEGQGEPGISLCADQNGRSSGAAVDTNTAGSHTFSVIARSGDGQTVIDTVTYTVGSPTTSAHGSAGGYEFTPARPTLPSPPATSSLLPPQAGA